MLQTTEIWETTHEQNQKLKLETVVILELKSIMIDLKDTEHSFSEDETKAMQKKQNIFQMFSNNSNAIYTIREIKSEN